MKKIVTLALTVVVSIGFSQTIKESIKSEKLREQREFSVTLPPNYEKNIKKKYPIMVLLDGEYLAKPFEGTLNFGSYMDDLPEMIIVAINQNYEDQRERDSATDESGYPSGSGASFFEFIGFELLPYVESRYRTFPFRVIAGHGITAGFINYYLYKGENPIFDGYIALAPELSSAMDSRVPKGLNLSKKQVMYYLASGEADMHKIRNGIQQLDQNITAVPDKKFRYRYDDFRGATHTTLVPQAIPQALYFIFDGYQPIEMVEFNDVISKLEKGFTQYLIDRYVNLETKLGLKVKPRPSDFNAIEAAILKNKAYPELLVLAKYAETNYPKTTLGVYIRGLYYEKTGQYSKAVKTLNEGFTREPIGDITKDFVLSKAESLRGKKDVVKGKKGEEEELEEEE